MTDTEVLDLIDEWTVISPAKDARTVYEYLGWTQEAYAAWVTDRVIPRQCYLFFDGEELRHGPAHWNISYNDGSEANCCTECLPKVFLHLESHSARVEFNPRCSGDAYGVRPPEDLPSLDRPDLSPPEVQSLKERRDIMIYGSLRNRGMVRRLARKLS